jgi:peptide chain release factor
MEMYWVQITSGRGPEECCRAAFYLLRTFSEQAAKKNIDVDCLEIIQGDSPKTLRSALLSLGGQGYEDFMRSWEGTIQWIAQSPFRPRHKRKNWFVGVQRISPPEEKELSNNKDFKFESMRSSLRAGWSACQ